MAIKVFVFDCGGVLLQAPDLTPYRVWEQRLGMAAGSLEERLWTSDVWRLAERGKITDIEFWRRSGQELGAEPDQAMSMREDIWSTWQVDAQVLAMIDSLRDRFRLAMLSNATDVLEEMLADRYGVVDRFETIVNSARVGAAKPEKSIYTETLDRLGVEPKQVVFIDDRADNITAAASMGMHVIWYVGSNELQRQLSVFTKNGAQPSASEDVADQSSDGSNGNGHVDG